MLTLNILLIFASTLLTSYILLTLLFIKNKAVSRLDKYLNPQNSIDDNTNDRGTTKPKVKIEPRKYLNVIGKRLGSIIVLKKHIKKIQQELTKAGLPLKGEEFLSIQSILFVSLFFIFYNLAGSFFLSTVMGLCGWFFPSIIVRFKKIKRYKMFNEQLGDAIVIISNSLKAGHSFLQAVNSVSNEMPAPISKEFEKVLKEMRLGVLTEKALENLLQRIESDDLELMITAVIIQRQIGGNLSEILDNLANTIRERVKLKGEIRTLTAQGRLSGIIIALLPIVISCVLYIINPDYLMVLVNNPIGNLIIGIAIINQLIGFFLINKIVKIEV